LPQGKFLCEQVSSFAIVNQQTMKMSLLFNWNRLDGMQRLVCSLQPIFWELPGNSHKCHSQKSPTILEGADPCDTGKSSILCGASSSLQYI
jgi:hypothetical protein